YTTENDALLALASPNVATQFVAREGLIAGGERSIPLLTGAFRSEKNPTIRARLLWVLDRIGGPDVDTVRGALQSDEPAIRALAVRILRRHGERHLDEILPLVNDPDGEVCKEALLAAGASPSPESLAVLLTGYERYDGSDRYLLETLAIASRGREE